MLKCASSVSLTRFVQYYENKFHLLIMKLYFTCVPYIEVQKEKRKVISPVFSQTEPDHFMPPGPAVIGYPY